MSMEWSPCPAVLDPSASAPGHAVSRFGHSSVVIPAADTAWGTELHVVFGGVLSAPNSAAAPEESHVACNTITVLAGNGAWFSPQTSQACPPRAFHAAACVGSRMFVFGGHVLSSMDGDHKQRRRTFFNDLWIIDADTWQWQQLLPSSSSQELPCKRDMASLTAVGDALVLFAGRSELGRTLADAWVYDITRSVWQPLRVPAPSPPPRKMHAAVYADGRLLVFGGERDSGVLDDLWSLKLPPGPPADWLPPPSQPAQGPGPGLGGSGGASIQTAGEAARWTLVKARPSPPGRFGHSFVLGGSQQAVMFGGCLDTSSFLSLSRSYVQCSELWALNLASFSWSKINPERSSSAPPSAAAQLLGNSSHTAHSLSQPWPSERMCHSMAALSGSRLLLVGGRRKEGICQDVWWLASAASNTPNPQPGPDPMGPPSLSPSPSTPTSSANSFTAGSVKRPPAPQQQQQQEQQGGAAPTPALVSGPTSTFPPALVHGLGPAAGSHPDLNKPDPTTSIEGGSDRSRSLDLPILQTNPEDSGDLASMMASSASDVARSLTMAAAQSQGPGPPASHPGPAAAGGPSGPELPRVLYNVHSGPAPRSLLNSTLGALMAGFTSSQPQADTPNTTASTAPPTAQPNTGSSGGGGGGGVDGDRVAGQPYPVMPDDLQGGAGQVNLREQLGPPAFPSPGINTGTLSAPPHTHPPGPGPTLSPPPPDPPAALGPGVPLNTLGGGGAAAAVGPSSSREGGEGVGRGLPVPSPVSPLLARLQGLAAAMPWATQRAPAQPPPPPPPPPALPSSTADQYLAAGNQHGTVPQPRAALGDRAAAGQHGAGLGFDQGQGQGQAGSASSHAWVNSTGRGEGGGEGARAGRGRGLLQPELVSLDSSAATAVAAAATAAEYEQLRVQRFGLPPWPTPSAMALPMQPMQPMQQYPFSDNARSHLLGMPPGDLTLQQLHILSYDYRQLARSQSWLLLSQCGLNGERVQPAGRPSMAALESSAVAPGDGVAAAGSDGARGSGVGSAGRGEGGSALLRAAPSLQLLHLIQQGGGGAGELRVGDVSLLLHEYKLLAQAQS